MDLRKRDKLEKQDLHKFPNDDIKIRTQRVNELNSDSELDESSKLTSFYWLCMVVFGVFLFDIAIRLQTSCEYENDFFSHCRSTHKRDNSPDVMFNDTLARNHLIAISKLGNRPCGSTANEIHTPSYIVNYLHKLKSLYTGKANSNIELTIDEQLAQLNSFQILIFGNHVTSVYDQIKNIVVRLHDTNSDHSFSRRRQSAAVLINCHYDSFFGGVGASDDLASCAVMLETIHSILKSQPISLHFDLIFLFNGAEENMLQGSHAFISQHKSVPDVKLVVNLEAAGSGGRQMVFQTSKSNPWLIGELAAVLKQPLASIIGQEIFSANLIPSDTDFRIFRDFAGIPGIDIAFIANGYVYHTKYDTEDRIPQPCLRNTGDNLFRLAVKLANSDSIAIYPEDEKYVHKSVLTRQRIIYFDFLGLVLVSYSELWGCLGNLCLVAGAVVLVWWRASRDTDRYAANVARTVASQLVWAVTNLAAGLVLGYLVHRFGSRMSWYAIRYNIIGLYVVPLVWYFFIYHQFVSRLFCNVRSARLAFEYHLSASVIIMALLTCALTVLRLLSGYVIAMWLLFFILDLVVLDLVQRYSQWLPINPNMVHFLRDTVCLSVPLAYFFYLIYVLFDVFIPIFGRAGPTCPDVVIGGLTALVMILPCLALSGSVYLTSRTTKKWLTFLLLHFSISYYIFLHCTQFGFPYNQSELFPRKQRIIINHVTRNMRNQFGQTRLSESGIWMLSLDSNQMMHLRSQLQQVIHEPMQEVFCELRPYCGYPMLYPLARVIDHSLWLPQRPHQLKPPASIVVQSVVTHISGMVNVTMQVSGPSHSNIYLMTPCSMRITSWSLGPTPPEPIKMPHANPNYRHYFIIYAYGRRPARPLTLWMMFMPRIDPRNDMAPDSPDNQVEIALGAHYLTARTGPLEAMLHLMPDWVVPTEVASTYEHLVVDFDQNLSYVQ